MTGGVAFYCCLCAMRSWMTYPVTLQEEEEEEEEEERERERVNTHLMYVT